MNLTIVKAVQTCAACPSQWDTWNEDGEYLYLRYRQGHGTVHHFENEDYTKWDFGKWRNPVADFRHGHPLDGVIDLPAFCDLAGLTLSDTFGEETP